jgi:two-component system cell cycle response regulator
MSQCIAQGRRNKTNMAVLFFDLDGFKEINDTHGHDTGDLMLKAVAQRLVASVRKTDTVARLGGDEFVVIALSEISTPGDAANVAAKLIAAVAQPYSLQGRTVSVTTSVGIGIYPEHGEDAEALMKSADLALYEAKSAGKNVYRIAQPAGRNSVG